jgi:threonine/homoserine/homoserine lactone efflux protein
MLALTALVPFAVGSVLVTVVPGPDMALVTRQVLAFGQRVARATIAGNILGLVVHTTLVAAGLSAVLLASARVFDVVRLVGGAYLVYLGVTAVLHARRRPVVEPTPEHAARTRSTAFRQGFLSTTLNPKPALFFATYLPQFVDPDGNVALQVGLLGGFHCVVGILWLTLYAHLVGRLHLVLGRDRVRRRLERLTGVVLVALGLRVALER